MCVFIGEGFRAWSIKTRSVPELKLESLRLNLKGCGLQMLFNNSYIFAFQKSSLTDSGSEFEEFTRFWVFHPSCNNKAFWSGRCCYSFVLDSKHKEMKQGHNIKDSKTKTNDTASRFLKDDWDCLYFKEWVIKCSPYFRHFQYY